MSFYENFQLENYGNILPASRENESIEPSERTTLDFLTDRERRHYECLDLLQQIEIQRRLIAQDEAALARYDRLEWQDRDLVFGIIATKQLTLKVAKLVELEKQYNLIASSVIAPELRAAS